MSGAKFLSEYAGQSLDELIVLEGEFRTESLVAAVEQALVQKADRLGVAALTKPERAVCVVEALEREVNNGGFEQFFFNAVVWPGDLALEIVGALNDVGCSTAAALTQSAIEIVGVQEASSVSEWEAAAQSLSDEACAALQSLDEKYFSDVGDLAATLFEFVKQRRAEIVLI